MTDKIEEILKELKNHPAMKFANDAILLQAARSSTKGYTGGEMLDIWLRRTLKEYGESMRQEGEEETLKKLISAFGRYAAFGGDDLDDLEAFADKVVEQMRYGAQHCQRDVENGKAVCDVKLDCHLHSARNLK